MAVHIDLMCLYLELYGGLILNPEISVTYSPPLNLFMSSLVKRKLLTDIIKLKYQV